MSRLGSKSRTLAGLALPIALILTATVAATVARHDEKNRGMAALGEIAALNGASHAMQTLSYAMTSVLAYDDTTEAGRNAPIAFRDGLTSVDRSLNAATTASPDDRPAVAELKRRFELLRPRAQDIFLIDNTLPGLTLGASLDRAQLEQLATAARATAEIVTELHGLAEDAQSSSRAIQKRLADEARRTLDPRDAWVLAVGLAGLIGLWLRRSRGRLEPGAASRPEETPSSERQPAVD
jgi:hypothetical protein